MVEAETVERRELPVEMILQISEQAFGVSSLLARLTLA
jgi:hypothetical protein